MICVTIGRGRHSSLAEEWKRAADAGCELVELRIDCLRREPDLKRILKDRPTPVVFTIRRGVDGGLWRGNEEKRQTDPPRGRGAGRRLHRPRDGHRHQDPPFRQDQADRQLPQHQDDAGRSPGHRREVRGVRPRRGQDRHGGFDAWPRLRGCCTWVPPPRRRRSRSRWERSACSPGSSGGNSGRRSPTPGSIPNASSPPGCFSTEC